MARPVDRVFVGSVEDRKTERCTVCGELLHPFPKPEYWMQYPLPECMIVDGVKVCDSYRKPECLITWLDQHKLVPVGRAAFMRAQIRLI